MPLVARERLWFSILTAVVLSYAFLAGLRPAGTDDLFFLLNDARWFIQHGEVPWTDHFSFTAHGSVWIYPFGGGLLFYALWAIGGFAALSYFSAAATAATVALTLRRGSVVSCLLAALAVPLIVARTATRADLFSTVLIAAFVAILWRYHTTGRARLWLLPVLMIVWVNTHLGFFVGLGLIAIYVGVELLELISGPSLGAVGRLRRACSRFSITFVVTLINPYFAWVYDAIHRQLVAGPWLVQSGEWASVPMPNWALLSQRLVSGDATGAIYLALALALTLLAVALWRRQFSAAAFLACAAALAVEHSRLSAFLGIISVVVGPTVLERHTVTVRFWPKTHSSRARLVALTATAFIIALACLRLTTWANAGGSLFEAGLSREFADGAISFIERERLPGNVLPFEHGAYFTWRLWPKYLDYTDSRSIPFVQADALLDYLLRQPPNALVWQRVAEHYGISALLASGDVFDQYRQFCVSDAWPPVYIDQHAVIFVRRTADTEELIERLRVDCASAQFPVTAPQGAEAYDEWLAAAEMLQKLERYDEALAAAEQALAIAPEASRAHLIAEAAQRALTEANRPALPAGSLIAGLRR
jgi:tetratricopeptide (TPR) repeat protein